MENIISIKELSQNKYNENIDRVGYTIRGHDEKTIPETTDASIWAKEFVFIAHRLIVDQRYSSEDLIYDEGWLTTWFANAIEAGRSAGLGVGIGR